MTLIKYFSATKNQKKTVAVITVLPIYRGEQEKAGKMRGFLFSKYFLINSHSVTILPSTS